MSKNNEIDDNKIRNHPAVESEDVVAVHEENKVKQPTAAKSEKRASVKKSGSKPNTVRETVSSSTESGKKVRKPDVDDQSARESAKTNQNEPEAEVKWADFPNGSDGVEWADASEAKSRQHNEKTKKEKMKDTKVKEEKAEKEEKVNDKKDGPSTASLLLKYFNENFRVIIPVAFSVVIILVAVILAATGKLKKVDTEASAQSETVNEAEPVLMTEESITEPINTQELLVLNTDEKLVSVVSSYYEAIAANDIETVKKLRNSVSNLEETKIDVRSRYIENYSNIQCYTVNGPVEGSYLAFVSYDVKFKNIETPAPGLISMYVCPDAYGNLKIYRDEKDEIDEETTAFFNEKLDADNVQELCNRIEVKYKEAIDADESLSTFMLTFEEKVKEEVAVEIAYQEAQENMLSVDNPGSVEPEEPEVTEPEVTEPVVDTPDTENPATPVQEEVKTTTAVNVRSSDSETADKIGRADMGVVLTRLESKVNGWSRVMFDGKEGYIKSEYLNVVGSSSNTGTAEATGKVKVLETVRVRASASTDGDKLGSAYTGEIYDLLMVQADGWTKILYNGKTAYIKSEFVQVQ